MSVSRDMTKGDIPTPRSAKKGLGKLNMSGKSKCGRPPENNKKKNKKKAK